MILKAKGVCGNFEYEGLRRGTMCWLDFVEELPKDTESGIWPETVIAFSLDGSVLATASLYNSIWFWNTSTGTQLRKFICEEGLVRGISVLPDELVVSISNPPRFLNVWNDTKLRIRRYRTTSTAGEFSPGCVTCDIGLSYDENSVQQGCRLHRKREIDLLPELSAYNLYSGLMFPVHSCWRS
jgi:WD40 repeat protein